MNNPPRPQSPLNTYAGQVLSLGLIGQHKLVLLALLYFCDSDGGSAFPSIATLAGTSGLCEETVRHSLCALRDDGWIVREKSPTNRRPATWKVQLSKLSRGSISRGLNIRGLDSRPHISRGLNAQAAYKEGLLNPVGLVDGFQQPTNHSVEDLAAILATLRETCPGANADTAARLLDRCRASNPSVLAETICGDLRRLEIPNGVHNPPGWVLHILPRRYNGKLAEATELSESSINMEVENQSQGRK